MGGGHGKDMGKGMAEKDGHESLGGEQPRGGGEGAVRRGGRVGRQGEAR